MANRYGLQIRAARGADAPDLLDLMRAYRSCSAVSLASRLDAVDQSGAGVALVAVEWGPPTGLIAMHWFPTLGDDLPVAQIDILLVSWDERRRGVGRLLLKSASRMARTSGCGSIRLMADASTDASLAAFCASTGFAADGNVYLRALRKRA